MRNCYQALSQAPWCGETGPIAAGAGTWREPVRQPCLAILILILAACSNSAEPSGRQGGAGSSGQAGATASSGSAGMGGSSAGTASNGGRAGSAGSSGSAGAGGGATGGSGGGATGGSAGMAGASAASCLPSYTLCEDFEATAPGASPVGWTAHGAASVAEDQANRGKRALKISPADNGERRIYHDTGALAAQHWGRLYYRVQLPVPTAFVHSTLVAFSGVGPTVGPAEFRVVDTVKNAGNDSATHQFLYNVQPQGAEFGTGTDYDWSFDGKWHCAEWHVDSADQSYAFYFDGEQEIAFTRGAGNYDDAELPTSFQQVRVGWNNYQSSPPGFTAWLDDFALASERIGCLP